MSTTRRLTERVGNTPAFGSHIKAADIPVFCQLQTRADAEPALDCAVDITSPGVAAMPVPCDAHPRLRGR